MRALVLIHRWLGVALCLLFAMWFTTGIVMHFVPFPALTEAERIAGLGVIDPAQVKSGPAAALRALRISDSTRMRLLARFDSPVYVIERGAAMTAVRATDLSSAAVRSEDVALRIAREHAQLRGLAVDAARYAERADYDQWTVSNGLDPHRPLYRIELNDAAGTDLYVSSTTGEVVRDTTRYERLWNYAGSVLHWIYPTALRSRWPAWDAVVWSLSLVALIAALTGSVLGVLRFQLAGRRPRSPFVGWQAWHHWLGIACMLFILSWIFSGWLSMDHGRLFSTGKLTSEENARFGIAPLALTESELAPPSRDAREIEWFVLGGELFRRERVNLESQRVERPGAAKSSQAFLQPREVGVVTSRTGAACRLPVTIDAHDDYPMPSAFPGAPVYRIVCGDIWFHIDGANGAVLEKLDSSRRAYRWLYQGLHTLDFPVLAAHPLLRTALIVLLCALGAAFSVTAVVIAWRRIRPAPHL